MILSIKSRYCEGDVELVFGIYPNGSTRIDGVDPVTKEPWFCATVALDRLPNQGCIFIKTWSENEGLLEELIRLNVVEPTGRCVACGFSYAVEARLTN